ncbi:uridine kinase [Lewinellaceae bacterium SD302]|nr:uridine kinase [Lewinellaceae bacterium SD302]
MKKPLVIGITGGSGSGKTTFINQLRAGFAEDKICLLSMDNYYYPIERQKQDDRGIYNFDRPKSIDKHTYTDDLNALIAGKTVQREEYTFNNDLAKPKVLTFHPAPVIITEGLFVFHYKQVRKLIDLRIFLHAKDNLKVVRRIKRDRVERNYPLDDVLYRYEHHVMPAYEKYVGPYRERADLIVNNNSDFNMGLKVVRGFLKNHLEE